MYTDSARALTAEPRTSPTTTHVVLRAAGPPLVYQRRPQTLQTPPIPLHTVRTQLASNSRPRGFAEPERVFLPWLTVLE